MNHNVDNGEIDKFSALAHAWWDKNGEMKPLHAINPLRLQFIEEYAGLANKSIIDVGCGGGILSEALAQQQAKVTAIDMAEASIEVAKLHLLESGLQVNYQVSTAEAFAEQQAGQFDIVTCLEMLEHVPDPSSIIAACAQLLKPGGKIFLSTLNRNPKAYLGAIIAAEYILGLLPKGTHDYKKFIKPSELQSWLEANGLVLKAMRGIHYNPLSKNYSLVKDVSINYLVYAEKIA